MEYTRRMAEGDYDIGNLSAKLTINGTDVSYEELMSVQNMLRELNESGLTTYLTSTEQVHKSHYGLEGSWDCIVHAQMGLKTSLLNAFCDTFLSSPFADMVKSAYQRRNENTIGDLYDLNANMRKFNDILKRNISETGNYSNIEGLLASHYKQVNCQKAAYQTFSNLELSDKETAQNTFAEAMKQLEGICRDFYRDGYSFTYKEQYAADALAAAYEKWMERLETAFFNVFFY